MSTASIVPTHGPMLLDSYIYGFAMTKMNLPFEDTADIVEMSESMLAPFPPGEYQNLADFLTEHANEARLRLCG